MGTPIWVRNKGLYPRSAHFFRRRVSALACECVCVYVRGDGGGVVWWGFLEIATAAETKRDEKHTNRDTRRRVMQLSYQFIVIRTAFADA